MAARAVKKDGAYLRRRTNVLLTQTRSIMAPRRRSYTLDFKICVLDRLRKLNGNISAASRESNIDRKRIREWQSKEAEMRELEGKNAARGGKKPRTLSYNRKGKFLEMEKELFSWITSQHKDGHLIDGTAIRDQARQLVMKADATTDFKASKGWLNRFVHRFKLVSMRAAPLTQTEPKPDDAAATTESFLAELRDLRLENSIEATNVANMDEFPMRLGQLEFTLVLAALADGTKLDPMLILKQTTKPPKHESGADCFVTCAEDGSLSKRQFLLWIANVWSKRGCRRSLLLLGARSDDEVERVLLEQHETHSLYVPAGLHGLVQPSDVAWSRRVKARLRRKWRDWRTAGKIASYENVVRWVVQVWQDVTSEFIVGSFVQCGLSDSYEVSELHNKLGKLLTNRMFVHEISDSGDSSDDSDDSHQTDTDVE